MAEEILGLTLVINLIITYNVLKKCRDINKDNIVLAFIFGVFAGVLITGLLNSMTDLIMKNIIIHISVCIVYVKVLLS